MSEYFISIIVPLYNSANVIGSTLQNLLEQTYRNYEVILVDDGSSDNTPDVLAPFFQNNSNIFYYRKSNGGVASARNFGIKKSKGNILALCDHDDFWHNTKLERQVSLFSSTDIGLVYSDARVINEREELNFSPKKKVRPLFYEGADCFYKLLQYNCIPTASVIFRKSCVDKVGLFDERMDMHGVDDRHMWLKIALNYKIAAVKEVLVNHLIHGGNWSLQEEKMLKSALFCLDEIVKVNPPRSKKAESSVRYAYAATYQHYGKNLFHNGEYGKGKKCFFNALKHDPSFIKNNLPFLVLCCFPSGIVNSLRALRRILFS